MNIQHTGSVVGAEFGQERVTGTVIELSSVRHARAPRIEDIEMATEGELTSEKIAAAEARTDTKLARFEGKLDLVISKLDTVNENSTATRREIKDSERAVKANAWVIGVGLLAVIIGLGFGLPAVFDLGAKQRETISREVQEQVQRILPAPPSTPK